MSTNDKKADRFVRIAERRTARVLNALRLLGQCSNKRSYEYTDDQVNSIFREIRRSLRDTEQRFRQGRAATHFRLR